MLLAVILALRSYMNTAILTLLQRIEQHYGVRILYACESGSRAWGFASPDSDYDIRFLFAKDRADYISVHDGLESIDLPLEQGLLDAGGWDLRKAAKLLGKSNGALLEWLHSPIIYREEPRFRERWQKVARDVFFPRASCDHYRGLAKQMVMGKLQGDAVRAKDYLYALRSTLAAMWVDSGRGIAPVEFAKLLDVAPPLVRAEIPSLLEYKARSGEGERMARLPVIDDFLTEFLTTRDASYAQEVQRHDPTDELNRLLRSSIYRPQLWSASDFTLESIRSSDRLLFDSVAGSHAYGTAHAASDEDRRGVFVAPQDFLLGGGSIEQVSDEQADAYFASRARDSQIGALASDQSRPLPSRATFLGRIANFINGELYGKSASISWAVIFPQSERPNIRHMAAPHIEAIKSDGAEQMAGRCDARILF